VPRGRVGAEKANSLRINKFVERSLKAGTGLPRNVEGERPYGNRGHEMAWLHWEGGALDAELFHPASKGIWMKV
jgi:hypothetical protein